MPTRFIVYLLLLLSSPAYAERSLTADKAIHVRLEVLQITAVVFPEPIESVPIGVNAKGWDLDYTGPYLLIMPLQEGVTGGRLFVIGADSGKMYSVNFSVATPSDDIVYITVPTPGQKLPPFSVPSYLRALKAGTSVPGMSKVDMVAPSLNDTRLALVETHATAVGSLIGMVLTVRNTQPHALVLDVRVGAQQDAPDDATVALSAWIWPPRMTLKALTLDNDLLPPGSQGRVYVVMEKR